MTSYHSQILLIARFWVDLFEKTVVVGIQPTSCLLNFHTCTLLFDFKLEKPLQSKRKSINQTLFSTKSTTLNPMVKSDLVTYRGVTMPNLFLQATNTLSFEKTAECRDRSFSQTVRFSSFCPPGQHEWTLNFDRPFS